MFPGLDLYHANPAQPLTTAGEELDDLDHDLSDLSDLDRDLSDLFDLSVYLFDGCNAYPNAYPNRNSNPQPNLNLSTTPTPPVSTIAPFLHRILL